MFVIRRERHFSWCYKYSVEESEGRGARTPSQGLSPFPARDNPKNEFGKTEGLIGAVVLALIRISTF